VLGAVVSELAARLLQKRQMIDEFNVAS